MTRFGTFSNHRLLADFTSLTVSKSVLSVISCLSHALCQIILHFSAEPLFIGSHSFFLWTCPFHQSVSAHQQEILIFMLHSVPEQRAPTHCLSCTRARDRDARQIGSAPFYRSEKYRFSCPTVPPSDRRLHPCSAHALSPCAGARKRVRGCDVTLYSVVFFSFLCRYWG